MSLLPLLKLRLASAETARRHRPAGRAARRPPARPTAGSRSARSTTYAELLDSPARHYGLLGDALPDIGDVQVRNRGTVGGAVAHAIRPPTCRPSCSRSMPRSSPARRAASGRLRRRRLLRRARSRRPSPTDELVTEIRLPGPRDDAGSAYASLEQPASGYSIVGVAAVVITEDGGAITTAGDRADRGRRRCRTGRRPSRPRWSAPTGTAESIAAAAAHATDGVDRQRRHPRRPRVPDGDGRRLHAAGDRGRARPARLTR